MNFPIPTITDSTLSAAIAAGCDCVMLKHDGWPVSINCAKNEVTIFSDFRLGPRKQEVIERCVSIEPLDALFVGAKSRDNPVIYLYDTWWMQGVDVQNESYRTRHLLTRNNAKKLDERFVVVQVYPIKAAHELWKEVSLDPSRLKGLVFRRSKDTAAGELFVARYYAEEPKELV